MKWNIYYIIIYLQLLRLTKLYDHRRRRRRRYTALWSLIQIFPFSVSLSISDCLPLECPRDWINISALASSLKRRLQMRQKPDWTVKKTSRRRRRRSRTGCYLRHLWLALQIDVAHWSSSSSSSISSRRFVVIAQWGNWRRATMCAASFCIPWQRHSSSSSSRREREKEKVQYTGGRRRRRRQVQSAPHSLTIDDDPRRFKAATATKLAQHTHTQTNFHLLQW